MHTHPSTPTRPPPSWLSRARRLAASAQDHARYWNVTRAEREASYPCDAYGEPAYEPVLRAVDVDAPAAVVFRWLCQLKVAPYSYDLLDNLGRHSPRELTPGAERLGRGQRFLIFELVDFEPDRHLTGLTFPAARLIFGPIAGTYLVTPIGDGVSLGVPALPPDRSIINLMRSERAETCSQCARTASTEAVVMSVSRRGGFQT